MEREAPGKAGAEVGAVIERYTEEWQQLPLPLPPSLASLASSIFRYILFYPSISYPILSHVYSGLQKLQSLALG